MGLAQAKESGAWESKEDRFSLKEVGGRGSLGKAARGPLGGDDQGKKLGRMKDLGDSATQL